MCPPPKPVYDFGVKVADYIVNNRFDLVNKSVEEFQKKGYFVYSRTISMGEYSSVTFDNIAKTCMDEAKEMAQGMVYNGIILIVPSINKAKLLEKFYYKHPSDIFKTWLSLFDWSMHYNDNKCIGGQFFNKSEISCEDSNLYIMVFYYPGRINFEE